VGPDTVAALLKAEGFSLQATSRTSEGARHPDRDAQFRYINDRVEEFTAAGQPVVSVDTTKQEEVLGDDAVAGREWHRVGRPVRVRTHDFPEKDAQKAVPYGIDDLAADTGWVVVGCDGDTACVRGGDPAPLVGGEGRHRDPAATRLLITTDAGGANGYRVRAWKTELADFAHATGLKVTVCHFPPGTSKWNKIEHRLFSRISTNWRGCPLTSHEVVVKTIGSTATRTGLTVHAELDPGAYPTGVTVAEEVMAALPLTAHDWHGAWNYTLRPEPPAPHRSRASKTAPSPTIGPGLAAPSHPHRHGALRVHRPAGRGRAVPPRPPPDQPAPQTCPPPHPAPRPAVPVRPAAGHRPPPPLEDPEPSPHRLARLASRRHRGRCSRDDPRPGSPRPTHHPRPITAPTAADLANLIGKTDIKDAGN
jgi:DDE family transposase